MKVKKIYFLIILLIFMLLGGCTNAKNKYIVSKGLQNFSESTAYDLNYSINIKASGGINLKQDSRVISKKDGDNTKTIIDIADSDEIQYMTNGYVYTKTSNRYSIKAADDKDGSNPTPDMSKDVIESTDIEETDNEIIYTIKYKSSEVPKIAADILGRYPYGMSGEMDLEIKVNKTSKTLKSLNFDISLTYSTEYININILIEVNSIGNDVKVEIPAEINQRIQTYIDNGNSKEFVSYEEPENGVLRYVELGDFKQILFDDKTKQLILIKDLTIEFYNLDHKLLKTITPTLPPVCADVSNGRLAVAFETNNLIFYDLNNNYTSRYFSTDVKVNELALGEEYIIYANHNRSSNMVIENLNNRNKHYFSFSNDSSFLLNKKDNMVYISHDNDAYFYNLHGGLVKRIEGKNDDPSLYFDGYVVHYDGKTYNPLDGTLKQGSDLSLNLYYSSKVALVETDDHLISIYDNYENKIIYTFYNYDSDSNYVLKLSDGKFLILSKDNKIISQLDLSVLDENLIYDDVEEEKIQVDGNLQTFKAKYYTKAIADDRYIYTINQHTKELYVYDVNTFENVYYEYFYEIPTSIDVDSGRLVIGFGEQTSFYGDYYTIKMYDVTTWDCNNIEVKAPGQSVYIYKDLIFYSYAKANDFYLYDLNTLENTRYDILESFGGYNTQIISKEDGIMYFGRYYKDLIYFDLDTKKIINSVSITSNDPISFDGKYIHLDGKTIDRLTGEIVNSHDLATLYNNLPYFYPKTIYCDNEIIVYVAKYLQNEDYTIVYDTSSDKMLYEKKGAKTKVIRVGNKIYLLGENGSNIEVLNLE